MSAETSHSSPQAAPASAPARPTSCGGALVALVSIGIGGLYLLNPTAGFVELIPDNAPLIGNLDEAGAAGMVILGLQYLARRRAKKPTA